MNKVAFIIISTILMFVVPILTVIIVDKIDKRKSSSLYNDDVKILVMLARERNCLTKFIRSYTISAVIISFV